MEAVYSVFFPRKSFRELMQAMSSLSLAREEFSAIVLATYQGLQKYFAPCHSYETYIHASCYEVPGDVVCKFTKAIFDIVCTVHRNQFYKQTKKMHFLYVFILQSFCNSTCFERVFRSSSEVHTFTISAALYKLCKRV